MTYAQERIAEVWDEAWPLILEHQRAVGRPVDVMPDRNTYHRLEQHGMVLYTLRRDGVLMGYATFMVGAFPQQPGIVQAIQDALFIHPDARGFGSGKFLLWVERQLRERGVQKLTWLMPASTSWRWLEALGYEPDYTAFSRTL